MDAPAPVVTAVREGVHSSFDGLSAIVIGVFLLVVIWRGNADTLIEALKGEAGFLKWAVALLILRWIQTSKIAGDAGSLLVSMVYILLAMKIAANPTIISGVRDFWKNI